MLTALLIGIILILLFVVHRLYRDKNKALYDVDFYSDICDDRMSEIMDLEGYNAYAATRLVELEDRLAEANGAARKALDLLNASDIGNRELEESYQQMILSADERTKMFEDFVLNVHQIECLPRIDDGASRVETDPEGETPIYESVVMDRVG